MSDYYCAKCGDYVSENQIRYTDTLHRRLHDKCGKQIRMHRRQKTTKNQQELRDKTRVPA